MKIKRFRLTTKKQKGGNATSYRLYRGAIWGREVKAKDPIYSHPTIQDAMNRSKQHRNYQSGLVVKTRVNVVIEN